MAGPRGDCTIIGRNLDSFTVFIRLNFGYQVVVTKTTTITRCGEDKSPTPSSQRFQSVQYAGSFNSSIRMVLNAAGTGFEPVAADLARYDAEYDAKQQQLTDAVAAENARIKTLESTTINVECEPAVRCPQGQCDPPCTPKAAVPGTATKSKTEQTVKTLFISGASVSTSGGAICSF